MTNRETSGLFVLLGLQIILILVVYTYAQGNARPHDTKLLIPINAEIIDELIISDDSGELRLNKTADGWVIPKLDSLSANEIKLSSILSDLLSLKSGWPVASTAGSQSRFKVAGENFNRRVDLISKTVKVGSIYVGTSPGFKKSHVRLDEQKNIYALPLNTYDLPTDPADWLDKSLIAVQNIRSIEGIDFKLVSEDREWSVVPTDKELATESNVEVNKDNATALDMAFKTLTVLSVTNEDINMDDSEAYRLKVFAPNQFTYTFLEKDDQYYVNRSDIDSIFTLSKFNFDSILSQNLESLSISETDAPPLAPGVQQMTD